MVVLKENPDSLFDVFSSELNVFSKNKNVCHGIAHKLGHESFELYGFEESMRIAKPLCGAGFIHGVIESKFGSFVNEEQLKDSENICNEEDEFCNHGIGHGIMVFTNNNLDESLSFCDSLKPLARSDCYDGVFMHVFDNEETGISKSIPERLEEDALCSRVSLKYQKSCSFYLPRVNIGKSDWEKLSLDLCNKLTGENYVTCIVGSGTMFGKYVYSSERVSDNLCEVFKDDKSFCLEGARLYRDNVFN